MNRVLAVHRLSKEFYGVKAVRDVSFSIEEGQIFSVIGPNGAGKSTLFNLMTGVLQPTNGLIHFDGRRIDGLSSEQIAAKGMIKTFQDVRLFNERGFTVFDNVMAGSYRLMNSGWLSCGLRLKKSVHEEEKMKERAMTFLEKVGLKHKANHKPSQLSFGEQRLVEIARALATEPRFLFLDEPAAGLNDSETVNLAHILMDIRKQGITLALIEHHLGLVSKVSDWTVVLDSGEKIAEGPPEQVYRDERVLHAYIGKRGQKTDVNHS